MDSVGSPRKFNFKNVGTFSPILFRYLKVYLELRHLFGPLSKLELTEIGVGFGGQVSLIHLLDKPISYRLYDIPPTLALSKQYIKSLGIEGDLRFLDGRDPWASQSDLLLSNYAFSEFSPAIQERHLKNVILNSSRGYITWNSLSSHMLGGYSLADLTREIPDSQIIPEIPLTAAGNAIIVWGVD